MKKQEKLLKKPTYEPREWNTSRGELRLKTIENHIQSMKQKEENNSNKINNNLV